MTIPAGGFIDCSSNILVAEQLLAILGGNRDYINSTVEQIKDNVDYLVHSGGMSLSEDVIARAQKIQQNEKAYIPDYTDRDNNTDEALDQYDRDLANFQKMIRECPSSHVKSFVQLLGLEEKLPTTSDTELARTGYSSMRQAINKVNNFPYNYLRSKRGDILDKLSNRILDDVDHLNEFVVGNALDALESKMPSMVRDIANDLEMLLICIERLACSSVAPLKAQYISTMGSMQLDPPFNIDLNKNLRPVPDYKLDSTEIYKETDANPDVNPGADPTWLPDLGLGRSSVKDAMNYGRGMTDKYFNK